MCGLCEKEGYQSIDYPDRPAEKWYNDREDGVILILASSLVVSMRKRGIGAPMVLTSLDETVTIANKKVKP